MKRELKRIVSLFMVSVILLSSFPINAWAEDSAPSPSPAASEGTMAVMETNNNFTYTSTSGGIKITGYSGSETSLTLPETLNELKVIGIGANAFMNNTTLTTIVFNNNLQFIEEGAFFGCTSLKEVEFPSSLKRIESSKNNGTFQNCTSLEKAIIPSTVTDLGSYIFEGCTNPKFTLYGEGTYIKQFADEYGLQFEEIQLLKIDSFTTNEVSGININTTINFTATVSGGEGPYSYRFFYDVVNPDATEGSNDIATNKTGLATFSPPAIGTYDFYVEVTDLTSNRTAIGTISDFKVINEPIIQSFTADKSAPQYVDTEINLSTTMEPGSGTEPFSYKFYAVCNDAITEIQESNSPTAVFKPTSPGIYTLCVEVTDAQKLTTKKEILNYQVVADVYLASFVPDKPSGQEVGTTVSLAAQGAGGKTTGYQYHFYYILNDVTTVDLQPFSANNTATFKPETAGLYDLYVEVKNAKGIIATQSIDGYQIIYTPTIESFTAATVDGGSCYSDTDSVVLTTFAKGGAEPYSYKYYYTLGTKTTLYPLSEDFQTDNTLTFKPSVAGIYTFYVEVKDAENTTVKKNITNFTVLEKLTVKSFSPSKTSPQNRDTEIKLTAIGSGGKSPYTYQFSKILDDAEPTDFGTPGSTNTATEKLPTAGHYTLAVVVTDANGEKVEQSIDYIISNNPIITSLTTDPSPTTSHYVKDLITVSAVVDGATQPLKYRFYYKLGSKTVELPDVDLNDNGTVAAAYFTPTTAGIYTLGVDITDSAGLKTSKSLTNFTVLGPVSVKSFSASKASPQNINTSIILSANGSGGKAPYKYKFSSKLGNDETILQDFSETNTVEFNPGTHTGKYTLYVEIKDANEKIISTKTIDNYEIINTPLIDSFTATKTGDEPDTYINDPIDLIATLLPDTDTGNLTYAFTYKLGTGISTPISTPSSASTVKFIPEQPGTYSFTVTVTDNTTKLKSTRTITGYRVLGNVVATLKSGISTPQNINTDIKLMAAGKGGKAPYIYKFYSVLKDSQSPEPIESTSNTGIFTSAVAGTYTLCVEITDANGKTAVAAIDNYIIHNPPVIDDFTVEPGLDEALYTNDPITLNATVLTDTGESENLTYEFYAIQGTKEIKITDDDPSDPTNVVFNPNTAGTYAFEVRVSDGVSTAKKRVTGYKILSPVTVSSLTANRTTNLIVGNTIKLTAIGTGGQSPYTYLFYDKDDGNPLESKSNTLKTIDYTFKEAGTYKLTVKINDANGNFDTKSLTVTVTNPPAITSLTATQEGNDSAITSSYVNKQITLTALKTNETGGDNITYTFSYKVGAKTGIIQDVTDNTATFEPTIVGTYTFYVTAKDNDTGLSGTGMLTNYKVLDGVKAKLNANKTSGQVINTPIKLTATATGGQPKYKYSFYAKLKDPGDTDIAEDDYDTCRLGDQDSASNFTLFTPTDPGTYILKTVIVDANGVSASTSMEYEITNPPIVTLTADPANKISYINKPINLTASVENGTGIGNLTYRFYYKKGSVEEDIEPVTANDHTATAVFTPKEASIYGLYVDVTDDKSVTRTAQLTNYKVLDPVAVVSLEPDKPSIQNVGTIIKLTATGTGGKTPYRYQFYKQLVDTDDDPVEIGSLTTSKFAYYKLPTVGTYNFYVKIIDANNEDNGDMTLVTQGHITGYKVVDRPKISTFSLSPVSGQYVDKPINLKAVTTGGSGEYEYTFSYKRDKQALDPITDDDPATADTVNFSPKDAGIYTFYVKVIDTKNDDPLTNFAEKTITSYKVFALPTAKITASKATITKGETTKLTATVTGGQPTYRYQFYYILEGQTEKHVFRNYTTSTTATFSPPIAGTYTLGVNVMDKAGITNIDGDGNSNTGSQLQCVVKPIS